ISSSVLDGLSLLRNSKSINASDDLFVFSHFSAIVKLLSRFGLINYSRLYCYGFFVHSPKWFFLFRLLGKLDTDNDHYIVFSREEISLYSKNLGLNRKNIHYLPCSDWESNEEPARLEAIPSIPKRDYYFAGGYSNRDYASLISVFRQLSEILVIVCS